MTWRDLVAVHPAAELFPMMSKEGLLGLGKDIIDNGMQQPLMFWRDQLIDGRNRLAAVEASARPEDRDRILVQMPTGGTDFPQPEVLFDDEDPVAFIISANVHRRHLTGGQKREIVAKTADQPAAEPASGVADETAPAKVAGRDGKADKKTKQRKPAPHGAHVRAQAIIGFSGLLHRELAETLTDLVRLLDDERERIVAIPKEKRVALARGYLRVLGLAVDDLRPIE